MCVHVHMYLCVCVCVCVCAYVFVCVCMCVMRANAQRLTLKPGKYNFYLCTNPPLASRMGHGPQKLFMNMQHLKVIIIKILMWNVFLSQHVHSRTLLSNVCQTSCHAYI